MKFDAHHQRHIYVNDLDLVVDDGYDRPTNNAIMNRDYVRYVYLIKMKSCDDIC